MSARGEPRETQIPGGHVLTCFRASDCFKMLLVSTARSVRSGALALAIITLFASGCATPVGVTRLDEQAAHRNLNANVLSSGEPSAYSTQILERTALSKRYQTDPEAVLAELQFRAWPD